MSAFAWFRIDLQDLIWFEYYFSVYLLSTGGMFEYVSGANFLGEITEWAGFALASQSIQSLSFAFFTAVVLSSRAVSHHK